MPLIAELRRRNVLRMAGLYLVGAWLLVQVGGTLLPVFEAPPWVMKTLVGLLALGFVPALVFSWVYELTPDGLKRDAEVTPEQSVASTTGRRMDRLIVAGLVAVVALVVADRYWPRGAGTAPANPPEKGAEAIKPPVIASVPTSQKSIAVLAFADLSPAKDQEYFSDGIAEEILNALAKVRELKVAGRTSSFYYKGRNEDLRSIGKALGVANVLEGSVRKQGDKVRITAQLVQAEDGFHLWSETYDGDLSDVFELQERIARKITDELKVVLQGGQERLVPVATAAPEAYAKFLQATAIFNRRDREKFPSAMALLEEAIRLDPAFARAHARLAALHVLAPEYLGTDFAQSMQAAESHARRAIELLPTIAEPHAVIAYAMGLQRRRIDEFASYERALALEPDDVLSNFWHGIALVGSGYVDAGRRQLDRVLVIDPMLPNGLAWRGWVHLFDGELADARRLLERAVDLGTRNAYIALALVAHDEGRAADARVAMELGLAQFGAGMPVDYPKVGAEGIVGDEAARKRAVAFVEAVVDSKPKVTPGTAVWALLQLGEPKRALAVLQAGPTTSSNFWTLALWSPRGREARRLPEFAEFARRIGYAAVWDLKGPPDDCRKAGNGDYVCGQDARR